MQKPQSIVGVAMLVVVVAVMSGCGGGSNQTVGLAPDTTAEVRSASSPTATVLPVNAQRYLGDMDLDGHASVGDAIKILRIVVGLADNDPCADANQSGGTDVGDAILVLRCVVGLQNWPLGVCGEGGDFTLEQAMGLAMATSPSAGSQANLDALEAWEDENNIPSDADELQDQLNQWVNAVLTDPNDAAAQLGLSMVILATAGDEGATYLGYNIFEELDLQSATSMAFSDDLNPKNLIADAMTTANLRGTPRIRGGTSPVRPMSDAGPPSVGDLEDWREAIRTHLLPAIENVEQRMAAIADNAVPTTLLLSYTDGETVTAYAADFHCIAAGLQFMRCGLLMVSAINPDYGSYNWDLELADRDANSDGILTVAEYAPPAPFGDIDGASWTQAGACLRDGVSRLQQAIQQRQVADPNELVMRALEGADPAEWNTYLTDAGGVLGGQVNVTVEYANWQDDQWVDQDTAQVPFNLRELWDNPPGSFRDLAPQLTEDPQDSGAFTVEWDDIPDKTLSGVFPDPNQIKDLMDADYDRYVFSYGSFEIGDWLDYGEGEGYAVNAQSCYWPDTGEYTAGFFVSDPAERLISATVSGPGTSGSLPLGQDTWEPDRWHGQAFFGSVPPPAPNEYTFTLVDTEGTTTKRATIEDYFSQAAVNMQPNNETISAANLVFTWDQCPSAVEYWVELYEGGFPGDRIWEVYGYSMPNIPYSGELLQPGVYGWLAGMRNANHNYSLTEGEFTVGP